VGACLVWKVPTQFRAKYRVIKASKSIKSVTGFMEVFENLGTQKLDEQTSDNISLEEPSDYS